MFRTYLHMLKVLERHNFGKINISIIANRFIAMHCNRYWISFGPSERVFVANPDGSFNWKYNESTGGTYV